MSVSLVDLRFRWQAYRLRERLMQLSADDTAQREDVGRFAGTKLFLSSGWETCVLIMWSKDEKEFWDKYNELCLGARDQSDHV